METRKGGYKNMKVLVIGANGKTGRIAVELLGKSAHQVRAMIRNEEQAPALEKLGAETVVADLEKDFSHALEGCDAVIFAAGSGSHTGPDKTIAVDQEGAIRSMETAERMGVNRYIMLSSLRSNEPEKGPEKIRHYLIAKKKADDHLRSTRLNYTIVRPGRLSDDAGTGKVNLAERLEFQPDPISRADVAQTLVACLDVSNTQRKSFDLLSGETPIVEALKRL
jgi:uncharacterized protein YbjT (DUF2867 family)